MGQISINAYYTTPRRSEQNAIVHALLAHRIYNSCEVNIFIQKQEWLIVGVKKTSVCKRWAKLSFRS